MRYTAISVCLVALAEVVSGSSCPSGDAQCAAEQEGSYCKAYAAGQTEGVCQFTDTPCSCAPTPPPTPTGGACPDGDAYCQQQTGDMGSYCKAAYTQGAGGVCQGGDQPCTCGGSTTSEPTSQPPMTTGTPESTPADF
ncbi:hypothetical protein FOL47_004316 [Perkinsus chesapeaki]|uniref:Uncharacterized protein n=1 Tax=Perkinsus chesapeaki TaxID=330153 RepID=A0A7J6M360_PERCH|nr:hypothetical protein FOL47_004316 [Perkinsus chesapeaki]